MKKIVFIAICVVGVLGFSSCRSTVVVQLHVDYLKKKNKIK